MTARVPARPKTTSKRGVAPTAGLERLQKVLAAAGIGSRRECEELIVEGRVEVDRSVVTELGTRVDPTKQQIRVDGVVLPRPKREYYLLNKPTGVVCTNRDPTGRARVIDLIQSDERLFPVGRLDRTSEGLILVTNDGELSNKLTHPRYGIEKTYRVRVAGQPAPQLLAKLRRGVRLSDGFAKVASIVTKRRYKESTELEIVLNEGRNREIRRLLARIGHKVLNLKRIAIGPLRLGDLPVGAHRRLARDEVARLRKAIASPTKSKLATRKKASKARPDSKTESAQERDARGAKRKARSASKTGHSGIVLAFEDETRPRKKRAVRKRTVKKAATKPSPRTARKAPRKKAKTTRKQRR